MRSFETDKFIMTAHHFSSASRVLFVLAAFIIVVAGLRAAESLLTTFLLSCFFAIICAPPFLFLKRKGCPSWISMTLVVALICAIQILLLSIITSSVDDFSDDLPEYQARINVLTNDVFSLASGWGIDIPIDRLKENFNPAVIFQVAVGALGNIGTVLSNSFLIILTVIFMLFEGASMSGKLRHAFGDDSQHMAHIRRFSNTVKQYMTIKTAVSFVTATVICIWLMILGVDNPLLWALIAFLLNFIPNIGSIIAAVPTVLFALIQLGPLHAALTALGYVVANMVMGNMVEPRFLGRGLGLSTLVVFLSLVFWGWVLGPIGMLLSVPLTILLKIALESSEDTKWVAILMDSEDLYQDGAKSQKD